MRLSVSLICCSNRSIERNSGSQSGRAVGCGCAGLAGSLSGWRAANCGIVAGSAGPRFGTGGGGTVVGRQTHHAALGVRAGAVRVAADVADAERRGLVGCSEAGRRLVGQRAAVGPLEALADTILAEVGERMKVERAGAAADVKARRDRCGLVFFRRPRAAPEVGDVPVLRA